MGCRVVLAVTLTDKVGLKWSQADVKYGGRLGPNTQSRLRGGVAAHKSDDGGRYKPIG